MKIKTKIFLLYIIFGIAFSFGCKKSYLTNEDILGDWGLDKFIINGIDTTAYVKSDSNCYGILRFFREGTGNWLVRQVPFYPQYNSTFHCWQSGYFDRTYLFMMEWSGSTTNIGPYRSSERLYWTIVSINKNNIYLNIDYHGSVCSLNLKRL